MERTGTRGGRLRRRVGGAAAGLALAAGLVVVAPSPASAHFSTYCGHGSDGSMNTTFFQYHFDNLTHGTSNHGHATWHDMAWGTDHAQRAHCV